MASKRRKRTQTFETVKVQKQDNVRTLTAQRTQAREEIGKIDQWIAAQPLSAWGLYSTISELKQKLGYLRDKILREDV